MSLTTPTPVVATTLAGAETATTNQSFVSEEDAEGEDDFSLLQEPSAFEDTAEQPVRRRGGTGLRINNEQRLQIVQFAVEHANEYRQMKVIEWKALLNSFIQDKFGKTMADPHRSLTRMVNEYKAVADALPHATGGGLHKSRLEEALDEWSSIVKSHDEKLAADKQAKEAHKALQRQVADRVRVDLTTPRRERTEGAPELSVAGGKRGGEEISSRLDKVQKVLNDAVQNQSGIRQLLDDTHRARASKTTRAEDRISSLENRVLGLEKEVKRALLQNKVMESNLQILMDERAQRIERSKQSLAQSQQAQFNLSHRAMQFPGMQNQQMYDPNAYRR